MKAIRQSITLPGRGAKLKVYAIADIHAGNALCDEALLRQTVKQIAADPLARWVGLGDMGEWINRKDPRHRESRMAPWLHGVDDLAAAQRAWLLDVFKPVRGKCLALIKGNHEDAILHHNETDVYMHLVEAMRVGDQQLALGVQGFLILNLRRKGSEGDSHNVTFYLHHGYTGGRYAGAKALALERLPGSYDFDVGLLGHSHVRQVLTKTRLTVNDALDVVERRQVCAVCGSFLRSQGDPEQYGEMKGYTPNDTGCVVIEIEAFRGRQNETAVRVVV